MTNRKSNDHIEYPRTKFQCADITNQYSSVQDRYNITHGRWIYHEKPKKSHYREATYHAYSTYMQTSKQAFRDQKPIKKEQKTPKTKKTTQKLKIFHNL